MTQRIGLIGCVKKKASHALPARDLYVSPLFRGRREYVERSCDEWFILSALHGVVPPDDVIEPYDVTLTTRSTSERRRWSERVVSELEWRLGELSATAVEIHAGATYRDFGLVDGLIRRGAVVDVPAAKLTQGEQLAFYARANADR